VVLVARREENLAQICKDIHRECNVEAEFFTFDFSEAFANVTRLREEIVRITSGNVAIVAHMAGNSDLARHYTDKPLKRNVEILRLQTEGTLVVLQEFCQLMCTMRPQRSAIITSGALPAYRSAPGFAMAGANKSFIRSLSIASSYEFKERIDIMCAHPVAVQSEILRNTIPAVITPQSFVNSTLAKLGKVSETNGSWMHDLIVDLMVALPLSIQQGLFWMNVPLFSKLLQRPVDMRSIQEKLPCVADSI
jgi:short-subunit dehydrogenase